MFNFNHLNEAIAVFTSNAISDHQMSFEIKPTIKHNLRKILNILSFNPIYQYAYKKECKLAPSGIFQGRRGFLK